LERVERSKPIYFRLKIGTPNKHQEKEGGAEKKGNAFQG